jgi:hypothetical protein
VAASLTPVAWLVVTAEPVTSVDGTAADVLVRPDDALHPAGMKSCARLQIQCVAVCGAVQLVFG